VNGFIDHLKTRLRNTNNYRATSNLHNSRITIALAKPFPACCVLISHSLATASNNGDSSALRAQFLSSQIPVQNSTDFVFCLQYLITGLVEILRFKELRIRCRGNMFTEPLPRNGRCLQGHRLATGLYATKYIYVDKTHTYMAINHLLLYTGVLTCGLHLL
jgi:hypothetical protein